MKNYKGTIIITDPCYISPSKMWGEEFNYDDKTISPALGFTKYEFEETGVGDWTCDTYKVPSHVSDLEKYVNTLEDTYWEFYKCASRENEKKYNELLEGSEVIGKFAADSGMCGVFYESEVLSINPKFYDEYNKYPGLYTKIPDFEGDIDYVMDSSSTGHFLGKGNINFITTINNI